MRVKFFHNIRDETIEVETEREKEEREREKATGQRGKRV